MKKDDNLQLDDLDRLNPIELAEEAGCLEADGDASHLDSTS